jgi:hypothetical protein
LHIRNFPTELHNFSVFDHIIHRLFIYVISNLVLMIEFGFNVLAGIVASAVFTNNPAALTGRILIWLGFIIVVKIISNHYIRQKVEEELRTFWFNPRPAPPIPVCRSL